MELLRESEFRCEPTDRVFREGALGRVAVLVIFGGIGAALCALPIVAGAKGFVAWLPGLPCLLAAGLGWRRVVRGLRVDHWAVRLRREGIALHLRSYLNADLPADDEVILWIPRGEVRALRPVRRRLVVAGDDGDDVSHEEVVELELTHDAPETLAAALQRERVPTVRYRTHHMVHLVRLVAPDRIEVMWRSPRGALRPRLARFAETASVEFTVEEAVARRDAPWRALDSKAFDDLVLDRCEAGDVFTAIRLLRDRHGWSLGEAREFVDELRGDRPAA